MAKNMQKFYVVWKGIKPGIYKTWYECQQQIKNFQGAYFKAFPNETQAKVAYHGNMWDYIGKKEDKKPLKKTIGNAGEAIPESWSVDAACSGNPGVMEYQCVETGSGIQIFHAGPFPDATNNIGEFLALVHALALLKQQGKNIPVYSDSKTAMSWVKKKTINTNLQKTPKNARVFEMIGRALTWIKNNSWQTPILKWDTENWGEIPADFGRK
ncbi:MAG: ribonuclease H family protein [Bacteroidales bacterium]|nr:ribonuclease H family protein [Bacteroidales bacterium]